MIIEFATVVIPLSVSNVEVPDDASDEEQQQAIYQAVIDLNPDLAPLIRKYGVIHDCSDEGLIE